MKIAFVSEHDIDKILPFSGIPYFMAKALRAEVERFHYVKAPMFDLDLMFSNPQGGWVQLKKIGKFVSNRLRQLQIDCVICQGSSMIPFLDTKAFICLWHDSTWQTLMQIPFEEFRANYPLLYEWDKAVLKKSSIIVYAADWVRDETISNYCVDPAMFKVLPFGASVPDIDEDFVECTIRSRKRSPCQLTFIGVDWIRKGLPLAYSLMKQLNFIGLPTILNVIGCSFENAGADGGITKPWHSPHSPFTSGGLLILRMRTDRFVRIWGFLNKDNEFDYKQFCEILGNTHFLIHPADFECFGVVLVEANAFGVPVLSFDKFGPRSIVKSGINGYVFEPNQFIDKALTHITSRFNDYDIYCSECRTSFVQYRERLNWRTNSRSFLSLISDFIYQANAADAKSRAAD